MNSRLVGDAMTAEAYLRAGRGAELFSSPNLRAAAHAAHACGACAWALTGPGPNPLARACANAVCLPGDTATVQESQLVALHMVCRAFEAAFAGSPAAAGAPWD